MQPFYALVSPALALALLAWVPSASAQHFTFEVPVEFHELKENLNVVGTHPASTARPGTPLTLEVEGALPRPPRRPHPPRRLRPGMLRHPKRR